MWFVKLENSSNSQCNSSSVVWCSNCILVKKEKYESNYFFIKMISIYYIGPKNVGFLLLMEMKIERRGWGVVVGGGGVGLRGDGGSCRCTNPPLVRKMVPYCS